MNSQRASRLIRARRLLLVATSCAMFGGLACAQPEPEMRQVNVSLHLNVPEGMEVPLNFVPDISGADERVYPGLRTGPADYTFSGPYPVATEKIFVNAWAWFSPDDDFRTPPPVRQTDRLKAHREMYTRFSLGWPVQVDLVAAQSDYSVTIDLIPAIKVTGQFVNTVGEPVRADLSQKGSGNFMGEAQATIDGIEVQGVAKGRATWLASMTTGDHLLYRLIHLTATQTQADVNIGSIALRIEDPECSVDITFTNPPPNQAFFSGENDQICLVAHDGLQCIDVSVVEGAGRYEAADENSAPAVPSAYAENYFVIPGWLLGSPIVHKVIDYCRDGRAAELIAAGIPSILPVVGQTTTMTLDATDVVNRVNALP